MERIVECGGDPDVSSTIVRLNNAYKLVVLDFYATWCRPCKHTLKQLEELTATHKDMCVLKIDIDACKETAQYYKIQSVPTVTFMRDHEYVQVLHGVQDQALASIVSYHMNDGISVEKEYYNKHLTLENLKKNPEMNGLRGVCKGWVAKKQRYIVQLEGGKKIYVMPNTAIFDGASINRHPTSR